MTQADGKHDQRRVKAFTDLYFKNKLPYAPTGEQTVWWDTEQTGLALVVGSRTKTFRCRFKVHGIWVTYTLGRCRLRPGASSGTHPEDQLQGMAGRPFKDIARMPAPWLRRFRDDEGKPHKCSVVQSWLQKLSRWAASEDLYEFPVMDAVNVEVEKHERDRDYSDAEIRDHLGWS